MYKRFRVSSGSPLAQTLGRAIHVYVPISMPVTLWLWWAYVFCVIEKKRVCAIAAQT